MSYFAENYTAENYTELQPYPQDRQYRPHRYQSETRFPIPQPEEEASWEEYWRANKLHPQVRSTDSDQSEDIERQLSRNITIGKANHRMTREEWLKLKSSVSNAKRQIIDQVKKEMEQEAGLALEKQEEKAEQRAVAVAAWKKKKRMESRRAARKSRIVEREKKRVQEEKKQRGRETYENWVQEQVEKENAKRQAKKARHDWFVKKTSQNASPSTPAEYPSSYSGSQFENWLKNRPKDKQQTSDKVTFT